MRRIDLGSLEGPAMTTKTSENVTLRSRSSPDLFRYVVPAAPSALLPSLNGNEPESILPPYV